MEHTVWRIVRSFHPEETAVGVMYNMQDPSVGAHVEYYSRKENRTILCKVQAVIWDTVRENIRVVVDYGTFS